MVGGSQCDRGLIHHPTDIVHFHDFCIHLKCNHASIASARGRGNCCRPVGEASGRFVRDASQARSPLIQYDMRLDESQPAWSAHQPVTINQTLMRFAN